MGSPYHIFFFFYRTLKTLDITGLDTIRDIKLLCLLLEDVNPSIEIIGVNYMELPSTSSSEE